MKELDHNSILQGAMYLMSAFYNTVSCVISKSAKDYKNKFYQIIKKSNSKNVNCQEDLEKYIFGLYYTSQLYIT